MSIQIFNPQKKEVGKPYDQPQPLEITITVEEWQALCEVLGAYYIHTPSYRDCKVECTVRIEVPKGEDIEANIKARGLYKVGGKTYYARHGKFTHVNIKYGDTHFSGKGCRSSYDNSIGQDPYSLFWQLITELTTN